MDIKFGCGFENVVGGIIMVFGCRGGVFRVGVFEWGSWREIDLIDVDIFFEDGF